METDGQRFHGLRAMLRDRAPIAAAFLDLGSPVSTELAAVAGFEVLVVDLEHGAGDEAAARMQILAAASSDLIVRVPGGPTQAARVLDFGASGILFPQVRSADHAAALAESIRYSRGRGVSGFARSAGYGTATGDWRSAADLTVGCVVQIERRDGLDQVDAIAALDDVDALLVGPGDLANSLGCAADLAASPLRDAALAVAESARAHGKSAGLFLPGDEDAAEWFRAGFTLLSCSFESQLLRRATANARSRMAQAFAADA